MIKAAFFDIDGTLLSFKTHQVSQGTVMAFERLHRQGIRTFISSGRPTCLIPPMPVSFDGYITMNGGYVYVGQEVLVRQPIPIEESNAWLNFAKERNICTMCFCEESMYASQINDIGQKIRDQLEFQMPPIVEIDSLFNKEVFQIIAVTPASLDEEVGRLLPHCRLPRWHPQFSDVVFESNSKAFGIQRICDYLNISPSETIGFGDGGNDIEMLEYCGIGVAMGNATDDVKRHADFVTTSVDEEGILNAVEKLILI